MKKGNNIMENNMSTDRGMGITKVNKTQKAPQGKRRASTDKSAKSK
jgi:hypothetical protein